MKFYCIAVIGFSCLPLTIKGQGFWTQVADFGGGYRSGTACFSIDNKGYVYGGSNGSQFFNDLWEYDPLTNSWTKKADLPAGTRRNAVAFSIGRKGYVGMGYGGGFTFYSDFWEWDQATDTWSRIADYPGEGGLGLSACVAFSIDPKGYVGTGGGWAVSPFRVSNEFWEYDSATNQWTQKPNLPDSARWFAVGFAIGARGYIGTGEDINGDYHNDFWEYDPQNSTWTRRADFPGSERRAGVGLSIDASGYIATGTKGSSTPRYKDLWEWHQPTDTWMKRPDYPGANSEGIAVGSAFSVGGYGYVGTGVNPDSDPQKDFWRFSPDSVSGFAEGEQAETISVWPNPTGSQVWIALHEENKTVLTISDIGGKACHRQDIQHLTQVDMSHLAPGVYFFEIRSEDSIQRFRIVKASDD